MLIWRNIQFNNLPANIAVDRRSVPLQSSYIIQEKSELILILQMLLIVQYHQIFRTSITSTAEWRIIFW